MFVFLFLFFGIRYREKKTSAFLVMPVTWHAWHVLAVLEDKHCRGYSDTSWFFFYLKKKKKIVAAHLIQLILHKCSFFFQIQCELSKENWLCRAIAFALDRQKLSPASWVWLLHGWVTIMGYVPRGLSGVKFSADHTEVLWTSSYPKIPHVYGYMHAERERMHNEDVVVHV